MQSMEVKRLVAGAISADFTVTFADIQEGVPVDFVASVVSTHALSPADVGLIVPTRTLERRRSKREPLRMEEVDGILRLLRVRAHALRVFESGALAEEFLRTPNPALGGESPIRMAATDIGAREVEGVLGRIEQGIYA